jgi:ribonuclease HII
MKEYSKMYPCYGFDSNAGYGTNEHIYAIKKYGACKIHRRSFLKNII